MSDAIIGVLIGGGLTLAGVIITNLFTRSNLNLQLENQRNNERDNVMRMKLEELHQLLTQAVLEILDFHKLLIASSKSGTLEKEAYDTLQSRYLVTLNKIATMLTFYANDLEPEFENLKAAVIIFHEHALNIYHGKPFDVNELKKSYSETNKNFSELIVALENFAKPVTALQKK